MMQNLPLYRRHHKCVRAQQAHTGHVQVIYECYILVSPRKVHFHTLLLILVSLLYLLLINYVQEVPLKTNGYKTNDTRFSLRFFLHIPHQGSPRSSTFPHPLLQRSKTHMEVTNLVKTTTTKKEYHRAYKTFLVSLSYSSNDPFIKSSRYQHV